MWGRKITQYVPKGHILGTLRFEVTGTNHTTLFALTGTPCRWTLHFDPEIVELANISPFLGINTQQIPRFLDQKWRIYARARLGPFLREKI